jgi:hypothetical protein
MIDQNLELYRIKEVSRVTVRWICIVKTSTGNARTDLDYKTNLSSFVIKKEHNHEPNVELAFKIPILNKMKIKTVKPLKAQEMSLTHP